MYTFIKALILKTFLHDNYLTILIILMLLKNRLLKLYIKLTILISNLQN